MKRRIRTEEEKLFGLVGDYNTDASQTNKVSFYLSQTQQQHINHTLVLTLYYRHYGLSDCVERFVALFFLFFKLGDVFCPVSSQSHSQLVWSLPWVCVSDVWVL